MAFGNNTASDISKFSKIFRYLENFEISRASIIAKYYVQVMLLFVYNRRREIFGNAQETFLFTVEKKQTQASTFVSMEEMIDSFFWNQYKPYSRQTT